MTSNGESAVVAYVKLAGKARVRREIRAVASDKANTMQPVSVSGAWSASTPATRAPDGFAKSAASRIAVELNKPLTSHTPAQTTPKPKAADDSLAGSPSATRKRPASVPMNQSTSVPPSKRTNVTHSHFMRSASSSRAKSPSVEYRFVLNVNAIAYPMPSETTAPMPAQAPRRSQT